ncbi:MAG: porin family protein, partial [Sphingomonadales bacterium]|nr:porin family protein [Sphingomonadales bacterium]
MRKLVIGAALASTAIATPALARDDQWYVGVDGGVMLVEDLKFDISNGADQGQADLDTGYDFGGVVGYDFGPIRLEAEGSYRDADMNTLVAGTSGWADGAGISPRSTQFPAAGSANALSFMVNALADFGPDDGLQGFVGAGLGVARVKVTSTINVNGPDAIDDSDSGLAWQVLAGVRAPLTDHWDVGLKYRYFNAPNVDLVDGLGRSVSTDFKSHSILGSLIYN